MTDHGARAHATWSASSTARNWGCPGALAMAARINKPEKESIHAATGTACHQIAEKCLRADHDADVYLGTTETTKEHKIEVDEELVGSAQTYVDYVRSRVAAGGALQIEQRFTLASLKPPFDAGGTADAVIHYREQALLEVVDLKNGMGVVEVEENKQLRTYALGAMLANPGIAVDRVKVTIVQPRAGHQNGRIRSETFHVADLMEWTADLLVAMRASKQAMDDLPKMPFATWWSTYLNAGNHCKFCAAEGNCPKQDQVAMDAAGVWFDDLDAARLSNAPDTFDAGQLAKKLDMLDMIEGWCNAVRAYAHTQAESGVEIPGYVLVDKIGRRKWAAEEEKVRKDLFLLADLGDADVFERKLRSPAQIEKVLGAKRKKLISNMWHAPVTGTNLVRADTTTRPAVPPAVNRHFTPIED